MSDPAAPGDTVANAHALFVLEQHLGHRTYADNLLAAADSIADLEIDSAPIRYERSTRLELSLPAGLGGMLAGRREVRAALASSTASVVLFNTQAPAALGGRQARARPYVAVTDVTPLQYDQMAEGYGHRPDRLPPLRWWKHRVNTELFRGAARCVGWSQWVCDSFVADYGVAPERTAVVPPGVDLTRWTPGTLSHDGPPRILFVGGDFERKGGAQLLEAFRQLRQDAELVLVTKALVDVSADPRITVVDDLEPNDPRLIELFRCADVFALPTLAETFGIAAVEAAAAGLPTVASAVGGLVDIVANGETGLTVPTGDVPELTRALEHLVRNQSERRRMGRAARRRAELKFDARANAARVVEIVCEAATDDDI